MRGKLLETILAGLVQALINVGVFLVTHALQIWLALIALLLAVDIAHEWRRNGCQARPGPTPICAPAPAAGDGCGCRCGCGCCCGR